MIVEKITQESITSKQLYYSRWHSVCTPDKGCHYDIKVAELVGPILSLDSTDGTFLICTYLTDLIPMSDNYTYMGTFKLWDIDICTMYLEDENGIRYLATMESLLDTEEGLIPKGTYCQFTDSEDEAYINSFFIIRDLLPKSTDVFPRDKDFTTVTEFVRAHDQTIKEFYPEKFI